MQILTLNWNNKTTKIVYFLLTSIWRTLFAKLKAIH